MATLFGLVALGSMVPVIPTGPVASTAAVVVSHHHLMMVLIAVLSGAAGAYAGDLATYAACRIGGEPLARRLARGPARSRNPSRFAETARRQLDARPTQALVIARLIPAGRIPMLLSAAVLGTGWRQVAVGSLVSCLVWSAVYCAIGLLGGTLFPEPWQGVLTALVLVAAISWLVGRVGRIRRGHESPA